MVDINMSYSIKQLADLAGVSVRTLHHYDEIGLLKPARVKNNGYRFYEEKELLKLQQIMFFRELDFPLLEIEKIIASPKFKMEDALKDQRKMIELKKDRLSRLVKTIDKTINKINKKTIMEDKELYEAFKEHDKKYAKEAKERWGNTDAYKVSQERVKKMSKEDMVKIQKNADIWMKNFALHSKYSPESEIVQKLIEEHYNNLRIFYEPSLELYKGLANMYVDDPRFTAYYEKYGKGLAVFMRDAMLAYVENHK